MTYTENTATASYVRVYDFHSFSRLLLEQQAMLLSISATTAENSCHRNHVSANYKLN